MQSLRRVDVLAVAFLVGGSVLFIPGCGVRWVYSFCIGLSVGTAVGIVTLARMRSLPAPLRLLRDLYPLLLLLGLYGEVDLLARLMHDPAGFDPMVQQWDRWLFGGHPHQHFSRWLSGPIWREGFHLLYLSYYLLVGAAFLYVRERRPRAFPRFAFVVTGMFVSFILVFVAFPVAGPLATGASLTTRGIFPWIVAHIYSPFAANGIHTGAFPSSHVGMSVGIVLLLAPRRWWARIGLGGLLLGIAASTVFGRFHYAVDTVVGFAAGGAFCLGWCWIYAAVQPEPTVATQNEEEPVWANPDASRPVRNAR